MSRRKASGQVVHSYGVAVTTRGRLVALANAGEDLALPTGIRSVVEHHRGVMVRSEASDLALRRAEALATEKGLVASSDHARRATATPSAPAPPASVATSVVGAVAAHADGDGVNLAILLDDAPECFALMLTSHPWWAAKYRPITPDEAALCGARPGHRPTYLAPVIRPRSQFSLTPRSLPAWRVEELLAEFSRETAS